MLSRASIAHWLSDGRGLLQVGNLFFNYLRSEMQGELVPTRNLPWGEEIARLSSASVLAVDHDPRNVNITIPEPPTTFVSNLMLSNVNLNINRAHIDSRSASCIH